MRIDTFSREFKEGSEAHLRAEIVERINSGEVPPEDQPQPIAKLIAQLDGKIRGLADPGENWVTGNPRNQPDSIGGYVLHHSPETGENKSKPDE